MCLPLWLIQTRNQEADKGISQGSNQKPPGEDPGGWWDESNKQDRSRTGGAVAREEKQQVFDIGITVVINVVRTDAQRGVE